MFILYGSGANGKSTFLNTLMRILGDYAIAASTETFMKKNGEQISNDIARLRGTRFVTTAEAEQGKRLSEPLIKQITGNDAMTARFLYGEFFDFVPTFKIFMATNHKPMIKGTDHGIWRRIKLIPFTTTIRAEKQDKHLEEKLIREGPGILNWLIEGVKRWFAEGLVPPAEINGATEEYRNEMDVCWAALSRNAVYRGRNVPCGRGNCSGRTRSGVMKTMNTPAASGFYLCG
jgi:putative DNA primase/helicase